MKKLLLVFPVLILQSCSFQPDRAALYCETSYGDKDLNYKEKFIIIVDYKNKSLARVSSDGENIWNLFEPRFSPKKIVFQNPSIDNPNIPDPQSFTEIDRNTLKLSSTGMYAPFGVCEKTSIPDLSGKGKRI